MEPEPPQKSLVARFNSQRPDVNVLFAVANAGGDPHGAKLTRIAQGCREVIAAIP